MAAEADAASSIPLAALSVDQGLQYPCVREACANSVVHTCRYTRFGRSDHVGDIDDGDAVTRVGQVTNTTSHFAHVEVQVRDSIRTTSRSPFLPLRPSPTEYRRRE